MLSQFFFSYKNIKNARHINASVQVSKTRYLSQGLAGRINTIKTMITALLSIQIKASVVAEVSTALLTSPPPVAVSAPAPPPAPRPRPRGEQSWPGAAAFSPACSPDTVNIEDTRTRGSRHGPELPHLCALLLHPLPPGAGLLGVQQLPLQAAAHVMMSHIISCHVM